MDDGRRIAREKRTVLAMIGLYCAANHGTDGPPCAECRALSDYATRRIDRCPLHPAKPTCNSCTVHCYRDAEREQIRRVMRYAGPRTVLHHPGLALLHVADRLQARGRSLV
jgi:hypothetical protein